jgi:hypothetical protein
MRVRPSRPSRPSREGSPRAPSCRMREVPRRASEASRSQAEITRRRTTNGAKPPTSASQSAPPSAKMWLSKLGLRFCNDAGEEVVTTAPLAGMSASPPCVVRQAHLVASLERTSLNLVWGVVGERRCWNGEKMVGDVTSRFSATYILKRGAAAGGLTIIDLKKMPE